MKANLYNKSFVSVKAFVITVLLLFITGISGWTYVTAHIETGEYRLVYPSNFGNRINIPADNPTTKQGVYLGRMLFYEKKLSANNTLSCGSCHQQDKAFTDGKAVSTGFDQVPTVRSSMSLANLLWARRFFWDGRAGSLEEQAVIPMTSLHEMGQPMQTSVEKISHSVTYQALFRLVYGDGEITGNRICKAISQFERTLISCSSRYDKYLKNAYQPGRQELNGMQLFENAPNPEKGIRGANCAHCHGGAKTYNELFHNNGLDSIPKDAGIETLTGMAADRGRFKVPTLRNIALTGPYMHDGRFKTLDEVVDHYSDHIKESEALSAFLRGETNDAGGKTLHLRRQEKNDIIAFLNMLTDSTFVNDPRFSDPNTQPAQKQTKTTTK
jgi:cytochrome c peroxidase